MLALILGAWTFCAGPNCWMSGADFAEMCDQIPVGQHVEVHVPIMHALVERLAPDSCQMTNLRLKPEKR